MSLKTYREKRHFDRTREPKGERGSQPGARYVIQKHAARRLHYDFRLELDGVLKSWAVPHGPSLDPHVKALAVQVEDHPIAYASFEGLIPQGEYGGGTVMVWDQGTWEPEGDARRDLNKGKLKFRLHGEKLKGNWTLVRMRGKAGEDGKNWLLIKTDDEEARGDADPKIVDERSESVLSGQTIDEIAKNSDHYWTNGGENKEPDSKKKKPTEIKASKSRSKSKIDIARIEGVKKGTIPATFKPELATLVKEVPEGDDWIYELKFDGYRMLCRFQKGRVDLISRNGNSWSDRFPTLVKEAAGLGLSETLLDGEVVVLAKDGTTDFQALQNMLRNGRDADCVYYVFDIPFYNGYDLTGVSLMDRKAILKSVIGSSSGSRVIRFSDHIEGEGPKVLSHACHAALEGLVAKRRDSLYSQRRSTDWLKLKCTKRQEFVIGGWSDPGGSRTGIGALLLGHYEAEKLIYCGRVGTGFSRDSLQALREEFDRLQTPRSPFDTPPRGRDAVGVHWIKPKLVAEIAFRGWTEEGMLRHASYQGLREDKKPNSVHREEPVDVDEKASNGQTRNGKSKNNSSSSSAIAGIRITHPDRVVYPDPAITKRDLAAYYETVWDWISPHLIGRPLSLVRCPQGVGEHCFFQKHLNDVMSKHVREPKPTKNGDDNPYVAIDDLAGLITLIQMGVLELHTWGCREDDIERPDRLIFDLDPGENVPWSEVVRAAQEVKERLDDLGLKGYPRTTGGKGIHIVVPLTPRAGWLEIKAFARAFANAMVKSSPTRFVAKMSKSLRAGKIFVDYLRNERGSTAIASYSTRARPGANVATPMTWTELAKKPDPSRFDVSSIPERLSSLRTDPWAGFFETKQSVGKLMVKRVEAR
jgi:bifunctional non-homologous end joining protein LigD